MFSPTGPYSINYVVRGGNINMKIKSSSRVNGFRFSYINYLLPSPSLTARAMCRFSTFHGFRHSSLYDFCEPRKCILSGKIRVSTQLKRSNTMPAYLFLLLSKTSFHGAKDEISIKGQAFASYTEYY